MKRLCLIVPDLNKGGMERVMSELANYFCTKTDTEVSIILLTNRSEVFYRISPVISIYKPGFVFSNRYRAISTFRSIIYLRRSIWRIKPNAVLSFGETYNSFVLLSSLFLNVRVFVSDRSRPDKRWGFLQENLRRLLYPQASGIISQTKFSKDILLKKTGHKNIKVIPNPVRRIRGKSIGKKNIILNVGRLIKSKRIDLLLNIFCRCENADWELWLVGENEGGHLDELKKLAIELNVNNRVKFWGKRDDIDDFYSVAKIFAFTSESEGLPNVLMEAMAAGNACISFDCTAGPSDLIVDGENGYLVKMHDSDQYIFKLNTLLNNSEIREKFSINAQKKMEEFNIRIIGESFYNFLLP